MKMCVMNVSKQMVSVAEAKQMDIVDYLAKAGHHPVKIRNHDYWYLSPIRDEKTPSFKVNRKLNRWYDHGIGKGGNLVDFGILYHQCSVGELLQKLGGTSSIQQQPLKIKKPAEEPTESNLKIICENPLFSFWLQRYLHLRHIPLSIAEAHCREMIFNLHDKMYSAIGFKNDAGGYELRNPYFKCSSSPKDITTIKSNSETVMVFEGFFDCLSYQSIYKNQEIVQADFVVLNSLSLFEKARPFLEKYEAIHLYFDNDAAGQTFSRYAKSLSKKYHDESRLYKDYKNLNEWLTSFGKSKKQSIRRST